MPGTQDTEEVLVYPSIFGRHGGFMFSNVSNPRKVIQAEESVSCDTEKAVFTPALVLRCYEC